MSDTNSTVTVAGSSGLIGTALVEHLRRQGRRVIRLVRTAPSGPDQARWDPQTGEVDQSAVDGVDAVINLAGAGVGDHRWTPAYKQELIDSRVRGTTTLVAAMLAAERPPRVFLNGSAQGFYGDRGDQVLDETASAGTGFLADLTRSWEAAAATAGTESGDRIRFAMLRTGLVMAPRGGAFGRLLPLIRLGLGGPLGNGQQWWSWITLADHVAATTHLLDTETISGPVNLCAPEPARNADIVRAIGAQLHRPTLLPAPAPALRLAVGEFSSEILASTRMTPKVLLENGFVFAQPSLATGAQWLAEAASSPRK